MAVITINGQIGCAVEVGQEVARRLGAQYVDRVVLVNAAGRAGATVAALEAMERHKRTLVDRLASIFEQTLENAAFAGLNGDPDFREDIDALARYPYPEGQETLATAARRMSGQRFFEVICSVIRDLAKEGNAVIVGRGSNFILKDQANAFHAGTIAPMPFRIRAVMDREQLNAVASERFVIEQEAARIAFCRRFFKADPNDSLYYDMVLNVSALGVDRAAGLIVHGVSLKEQARQ